MTNFKDGTQALKHVSNFSVFALDAKHKFLGDTFECGDGEVKHEVSTVNGHTSSLTEHNEFVARRYF